MRHLTSLPHLACSQSENVKCGQARQEDLLREVLARFGQPQVRGWPACLPSLKGLMMQRCLHRCSALIGRPLLAQAADLQVLQEAMAQEATEHKQHIKQGAEADFMAHVGSIERQSDRAGSRLERKPQLGSELTCCGPSPAQVIACIELQQQQQHAGSEEQRTAKAPSYLAELIAESACPITQEIMVDPVLLVARCDQSTCTSVLLCLLSMHDWPCLHNPACSARRLPALLLWLPVQRHHVRACGHQHVDRRL